MLISFYSSQQHCMIPYATCCLGSKRDIHVYCLKINVYLIRLQENKLSVFFTYSWFHFYFQHDFVHCVLEVVRTVYAVFFIVKRVDMQACSITDLIVKLNRTQFDWTVLNRYCDTVGSNATTNMHKITAWMHNDVNNKLRYTGGAVLTLVYLTSEMRKCVITHIN